MEGNGVITINKEILMEKGYSQGEGIDYEETYSHVARLQAFRLLLAFTCFLDL